MFRIQENNDGTTSIFDKNTGNLVCTIPTKGNSCSHRPVNVVEPQLANEAPPSDRWPRELKRTSRKASVQVETEEEENDESSSNGESSVSLCSLPNDEDYRLDNATQEQFAKCLGLVSNKELQTHTLPELLAEWPLRLLSKSSAFRTSENSLLKDIKVPDQLPITSSYGVRLLHLNKPHHFASKERISQSLRSYESFCRHPYNTACPSACHFPKLRCRSEKAYPVHTPSRVLRHLQTAHVYTRGRRQREERKRTLRTGLDARSRRLFRLCNAKQCTVDIVRIPQHEIDDWLSRVTTINIIDSEDEDSEPECYIPRPRLPPRRGLRCSLQLRNVVKDIQRKGSSYYVRNTHIEVPFFKDFLSSLTDNRPLINAVYTVNANVPKTKFQQSPNPKLKPPPTKQTLVIPPVNYKPHQVITKVIASSVSNKPIPVIDLTEETTPPKVYPLPMNRCPINSGQKNFVNSRQVGVNCGQKVVVNSGRQVGVNSRQKVLVNSGLQVRMTNGQQVGVNSGQKMVVNSGQQIGVNRGQRIGANSGQRINVNSGQRIGVNNGQRIGVNSRQKVLSNSGQRELDGNGSRQVLVNAQGSNPNGGKHTVLGNRHCPTAVNGRKLVPNNCLVAVNSSCPPPSKSLVVAENGRRSTGVKKHSLQLVTGCERQVVTSRRGHKPSVHDQVVTGRPLVSPSRFVVSQYKFQCFACGLQRNYIEQANSQAVERAVREHMNTYHATSNAESFLSRYLDSVNHCTVIEAFPGYKED